MNYTGMFTLYLKEVNRFLNVYKQTLLAPLINTLLLLSIFSVIFRGRIAFIEGIPFLQFIVPGLIMMTIIQNAFANTSSTLTFSKVLGLIVDLLLPPLSAKELTIALSLGGATRGIATGLTCAAAIMLMGFFVNPDFLIHIHNFPLMLFYLFFGAMLLSLIGMICGILSDSFDQMSAYTSFIITPLSFLSGTFYSVKNLPPFWYSVNHFNPFFYIIDGFRYSLTGHNDFDLNVGITMLVTLNIIFFAVVYAMLKRGYRIKN